MYSGITNHKLVSQSDRTHLDDPGMAYVNDFDNKTLGGQSSFDGYAAKLRKPSQIDLLQNQDFDTVSPDMKSEIRQDTEVESYKYSQSVRRKRAKERAKESIDISADIKKQGKRRQRRQRF